MPKAPWSEANIGVDAVDNNMELSPELSAELIEKTNGEGEVELASSSDASRTMDAVMSEVTGEKQGEEKEQKNPDDGLSPKQRAEIRWQLMKTGISQWWSNNWPKVLVGATAAIGGFIALNVVTEGAITAALPAIMSVVGPLFVGVTIAQIGGHVRDYLAKGWEGDIQGGGKSLAKGLAAGAIELASWLTFKAGSAALKGAKAVAKGGMKLAKGAINLIAKGAKFIIEKGKVLFKGIVGTGIGKSFQRLRQLGEGLLERMRFKKFRIRMANKRFRLEGQINPWILLAEGRIDVVAEGTEGAVKVTDDQLKVLNTISDDARQALKKLKKEEVDQLVKLLQNEPSNADDILKQYFYKAKKGKAEIPEDVAYKLQNSLDNFEAVKTQGHPYGFNNVDEFKTFQDNLKSALGRYDIPIDDIRVHGSAVHKTTPGDLDVAILVDDAKFQELGERFIANSNQPKVAKSIIRELAQGKIPSYRFRPGEGASVVTSLGGKAGNLEKIQVSLIRKGSSFDIGPYLPL